MWVTALLCFIVHAAYAADVEFAFYKGELYANVHAQYEDRAAHVLYFLYAMRARAPHVFATLGQVAMDGESVGTTFAFWRRPGAQAPRLFPDYDWTGWAAAWIPPHQAVQDVFSREHVPWESRSNTVYMQGALTSPGRQAFSDCGNKNYVAGVVDWKTLRQGVVLPFSEHGLKPAGADLRQLLQHRYLVYIHGIGWSTSLKRIISAGAAVFFPEAPLHETHIDVVLRSCIGCVLHYNLSDICDSIDATLKKFGEYKSQISAQRMNKFVKRHFTPDTLQQYTLGQLEEVATSHPFPKRVRVRWDTLVMPNGSKLKRQTCAGMKDAHKKLLAKNIRWQIDAWFDSECRPASSLPYLSYTAV